MFVIDGIPFFINVNKAAVWNEMKLKMVLPSQKSLKVPLCHVWIRLVTVCLLCAGEFRQNMPVLRVHALDALKSWPLFIILSKLTHKGKYTVIYL